MIKEKIKKFPLLGSILTKWYQVLKRLKPFNNSRDYWESRYRRGGNSGTGSYAELAEFKAKVVNEFVKRHAITDAIELGCGDGHQLGYFQIANYTGYDVSKTAIMICQQKYQNDATKQFHLLDGYQGEQATLVLSLDVIFHLIEEEVYQDYMKLLFTAASKYVVIYSSNREASSVDEAAAHFKHRKFTGWVAKHWPSAELLERITNKFPYQGDEQGGSVSDFYIFRVG